MRARLSAVRPTRGLLLVVLAAVLWGTTGVIAAVLYEHTALTPVDVSFYRMAIGGLALAPLAMCGSGGASLRLHRRTLLAVGAGLAAFQVCYFAAVAVSGVALATLVTLGVAPLLVAAGSRAMLGEALERRTRWCLAAAVGGVLLLFGAPTGLSAAAAVSGSLLAIGSAVGYAAVTLGSRHARDRMPVVPFTAASFVVGAVVIAPLAVGGGLMRPGDAATVALLAYLGLVPTALGYALFFTGLRTATAARASVATLVEPATATLLAVAVLGERLAARGWLGAGILLTSVLWLAIGRRPERRDAGRRRVEDADSQRDDVSRQVT